MASADTRHASTLLLLAAVIVVGGVRYCAVFAVIVERWGVGVGRVMEGGNLMFAVEVGQSCWGRPMMRPIIAPHAGRHLMILSAFFHLVPLSSLIF